MKMLSLKKKKHYFWSSRCGAMNRRRLGSSETQIQSLAQPSGLRIQRCCSCSLGWDCGLDLIPHPGTPYAMGQPNKNKNAKKSPTVSKALCMYILAYLQLLMHRTFYLEWKRMLQKPNWNNKSNCSRDYYIARLG